MSRYKRDVDSVELTIYTLDNLIVKAIYMNVKSTKGGVGFLTAFKKIKRSKKVLETTYPLQRLSIWRSLVMNKQ